MMKRSHVLLLCIAVSLGSIAATLAILSFLTPSSKVPIVAFSDFVSEVHAGHVDEIRIHDRVYRFRLRSAEGGRAVEKETVGPTADAPLLKTLVPDSRDQAPPKIRFE
jgi:hypothetical protein